MRKSYFPNQISLVKSTISSRNSNFLFPFGATLNVVRPSAVALSSGSLTIPTNRPICAYYSNASNSGKLVVVGSYLMFTDSYLDKEKNDALREMIFDFFDSDMMGQESYSDEGDVSQGNSFFQRKWRT